MMCKKVIVTILLWCWFYSAVSGKQTNFCFKILRHKGYYYAMERTVDQVRVRTNFDYLCRGVVKFTNYLFHDPEALLCAETIRIYMAKKNDAFRKALFLCSGHRPTLYEMQCGSEIRDFQNCIEKHMNFTLKGLAFGEKHEKHACAKCREAPFVKKCSEIINKNRKCKDLYYAINSGNIGSKSCKICNKTREIMCVSEIRDFDNCIKKHMIFTVKGLALKEGPDKHACAKCREAPFVKKCSEKIKRNWKCKKLYNAIKTVNIGQKSCKICDKIRAGEKANVCSKILQHNGYYTAMERLIYQTTVKRNYNHLCSAVKKFSIEFFNDPGALLCAEPIRNYVMKRYTKFLAAQLKCISKANFRDEMKCESEIGDFHKCIQTNMVFTLKGLAQKEKPDKHACAKCWEVPYVKQCSAVIKTYGLCKKLYNALYSANIGEESCAICFNVNDFNGKEALTGVKPNGEYNVIIVASAVGGILLIPAAVVVITYILQKRKNNEDAEEKIRDPYVLDVATKGDAPSGSRSSRSGSTNTRRSKNVGGSKSRSNRTETDITSSLAG